MNNHPSANGLIRSNSSHQPAPPSTAEELTGLSNDQLAGIDPLEMNLLVAKGIPSLAHLDIAYYQKTADRYASEIAKLLPGAEAEFLKTPQHWKNDVRFFRLGMVCWYVDQVLGIRYREDQKFVKEVFYTNPCDLFLNGVLDTRRGTCGNMAALHVALGWRLGWPVSLACIGPHFICRFDDGAVTHNIEATKNGGGGFHSHPDEFYEQAHQLPEKAILCGSDLRAVRPRELLGLFFGLRARHLGDSGREKEAEADYLLARCLFPQNRYLYIRQMANSVPYSIGLFEPGERGHPIALANWLQEMMILAPWYKMGALKRAKIAGNHTTQSPGCTVIIGHQE